MKLFIITLAMAASLVGTSLAREWTANDGRTIQAQLINYSQINEEVTLKRSDGKVFHIPIERLSWRDNYYLESLYPQSKTNYSGARFSRDSGNFRSYDSNYINYVKWRRLRKAYYNNQRIKINNGVNITINL